MPPSFFKLVQAARASSQITFKILQKPYYKCKYQMRLIKCLICTRLKFDFCFHFSFFSLSLSLSLSLTSWCNTHLCFADLSHFEKVSRKKYRFCIKFIPLQNLNELFFSTARFCFPSILIVWLLGEKKGRKSKVLSREDFQYCAVFNIVQFWLKLLPSFQESKVLLS